ncbi:hypothetical protein D3C72_2219250 [compost metagenome]
MQFLSIDPSRQANPENETASGPGHLRAFGEVLLYRQLIGAEVFAVLLTNVTQVPVVATVLKISSNPHLGHATG